MKRTNTFSVRFKDNSEVLALANGCSALWDVLNYKRRQSFFAGNFDWDSSKEYKSFAPNVGSATAQQVICKNNTAWRVFFKLLKMKGEGELKDVRKVSPPGYWKDRDTNKVILRILIRNDCYKIKGRTIRLPKRIRGRIMGNLKWTGKQGLLEIRYDTLKHKWYAYQPVETQAISQPIRHNHAYVDLGVRYPITSVIESVQKPIAYNGTPLLTDWWYWNKRIAEHQSELKRCTGKNTSSRLKKLYQTRQRRFRNAINNYVSNFVKRCEDSGVSEIVVGDLTGIRNNASKGTKTNTMINNFWGHRYLTERIQITAENHGMTVSFVDERGTSSVCPRCGSDDKIIRRGRLFKCKACGLEAHRDCVGAFNISLVHGSHHEGDGNWVMTHPEVVNDFVSFHTNSLKGTP